MDINLAITRTAVFMLVYTLAAGIPLFIAWGWRDPLRDLFGQSWLIGFWTGSFILATAAHYANFYFQRRAEKRVLKEQREYQHRLRQAAAGMTLIKDLKKLLGFIVHILTRTVKIHYAGVWLLDPRLRKYVLKATRGQNGARAGETIDFTQALVLYLLKERKPIVKEELQQLSQDERFQYLKLITDELRRIGAAVLIPTFIEAQLVGFLVMGEKKSGQMYTNDDLEVFAVLASQTALAIENAQFYEELKGAQAQVFQTAKMADLGRMAGGMSHQVNNRFHVLSLLTGMLMASMKELEKDPSFAVPERIKLFWSQLKEKLKSIENNALQGGDIVKKILQFSRPAGEYKPVTLPQIITLAVDVVQYKVDLSRFDLKQELLPELPAVKGDLNTLAESLINLISNGYDAMEKKAELLEKKEFPPAAQDPVPYRGCLTIKGRTEKINRKEWVVWEVQENGVGMTKSELECLFLPFFTTKATAQKGTGLGLYVIQKIIQQHGGTIAAQSTYGVGTKFIIRLPAYYREEAPDQPPPGNSSGERPNAA